MKYVSFALREHTFKFIYAQFHMNLNILSFFRDVTFQMNTISVGWIVQSL